MTARRAGLALLTLCVELSGCGGAKGDEMPPLGPTLEVVNTSSLVYRVTLGSRVFQVHPGQRKCVRVGHISETRAIAFFALASARTYRTPPENLTSSPGWIVEIGTRPKYDVLSLRPAKPCMQ